jgi:hypothetical protein
MSATGQQRTALWSFSLTSRQEQPIGSEAVGAGFVASFGTVGPKAERNRIIEFPLVFKIIRHLEPAATLRALGFSWLSSRIFGIWCMLSAVAEYTRKLPAQCSP